IAWQIRSLEAKAKAYQWGAFKAQVKEPRSPLLELPIVKAPVILQELSRELSRQFRKALAEKGSTSYTNIEITLVYDRLNVKNFSSISPDGRGNLVCIPKGELIGKNHPSRQKLLPAPGEDGSMMHYLVFGKRFDTQQPLRTMVAIPITGTAQLERVARVEKSDGPGTSGGRKS
ncbi:MAG: hypothetical protein K2X66_11985, partial [Cyanobacteria bacterium]|nr:hypothetical protein [Cyanobacteriota bacterium]